MSAVRGRRGGPAADGRSRRSPARPGTARGAGPARGARPGKRRDVRAAVVARRTAIAVRTPLLTGRTVLLVALVLLLALTLAGPIRQYVAGRQELAALAAQGGDLEQRIQDLRDQLQRQGDPAYVRSQATARLSYVLPDDRLVVVADGQTQDGGVVPDATSSEGGPPGTWYGGLLESVATADGDPTP